MLYFEKSQPAPECLAIEKQKVNGDCKCGCVLERLHTDFKNKCYICEIAEPTSINVEHFKPHRGDINLKFDWNNLFFACTYCNKIKHDKFENILNCTDPNDFINEKLGYKVDPFPIFSVNIDVVVNDSAALATKELLLTVFNGNTKSQKLEAGNLRKILQKELEDFQKNLVNYEVSDFKEKQDYLKKIEYHLNKASAFTSFKRQIIKDNQRLNQEFGRFIN